jgi:hypothetical protein
VPSLMGDVFDPSSALWCGVFLGQPTPRFATSSLRPLLVSPSVEVRVLHLSGELLVSYPSDLSTVPFVKSKVTLGMPLLVVYGPVVRRAVLLAVVVAFAPDFLGRPTPRLKPSCVDVSVAPFLGLCASVFLGRPTLRLTPPCVGVVVAPRGGLCVSVFFCRPALRLTPPCVGVVVAPPVGLCVSVFLGRPALLRAVGGGAGVDLDDVAC